MVDRTDSVLMWLLTKRQLLYKPSGRKWQQNFVAAIVEICCSLYLKQLKSCLFMADPEVDCYWSLVNTNYLLKPKTVQSQRLSCSRSFLQDLWFCAFAAPLKPNQALVSGAELNLTEFTEQDCEGQYRVYSGVQYSHIRTGTEGSMWNTPSCFPSWVILKGYDWK